MRWSSSAVASLLLALLAAAAAWSAEPPAPAMKPIRVGATSYFVQGQSALGSVANRNFISNAGFVVTADSVVVIDALGSPALAEALIREIRAITPKPISHVFVTHYHADHIYGLQAFKAAGAAVVAHRRSLEYIHSETARQRLDASRRQLAPWVDARTEIVPADRWLDGDADFDIGGTRFRVSMVGPAHTPEDLVVFVASDRVLYAGDLVFSGRIPYVGQADSRRWIEALEKVLAFDAAAIVPGHGPQSTRPREDLTLTRDYLVFLRKAMGEAARNLEPFDEAYARTDWSRFEKLPLFNAANRMNAYNTYLLLEQER